MRGIAYHRLLTILGLTFLPPSAGAEGPAAFDSVAPQGSLTPEALQKKAGWKAADPRAPVGGDALIENGRMAVHFRKSDGSVVLYYRLEGKLREAARVVPSCGGSRAVRFTSLVPDAAAPGEKAFIALGESAGGKAISLRSSASDRPIVEFRALEGLTDLQVSYRSAHAVLPEIFGDDLVLRAGESGEALLRLPGEHALLHPIDEGDALLLFSWPPAAKEILVRAGKVGDHPAFVGTGLPCRGSEKAWISVLSGRGLWHEVDSARFSFSEYRPLDWEPPFPARYRADLKKAGPWGLTDSWMRQPRKDKFWMAFLSNGFPPLAIDSGGAFARLPRFRPGLKFPKNLPAEIEYAGPLLIYPFERESEEAAGKTPETEWTVLDAVRATLGPDWARALDIGEGILAVEPFPKGFVFAATCVCTGSVEETFKQGREKAEVAKIRATFEDMNRFVRYHRQRIEEFISFAAGWRKLLAERRASIPAEWIGPELERALGDLEPLLQYFPELFEAHRETIRTPESCVELTEKAIGLAGDPAADRLARVKELGVAMRTIGGRQDDMLAAYRMTVKAIRQRAGQIHASARDAAVRALMSDLRIATRSALRTCTPYEEFEFLTAAWLVQKQ
jgi:hypothetical protein